VSLLVIHRTAVYYCCHSSASTLLADQQDELGLTNPKDSLVGDLGRIADPRPVAIIIKLATGGVVQRQVFTKMVGHGETGFLGRSSDLDRSTGNGVRIYEIGLGFATRPWPNWLWKNPLVK